jgi:hypothetical protein
MDNNVCRIFEETLFLKMVIWQTTPEEKELVLKLNFNKLRLSVPVVELECGSLLCNLLLHRSQNKSDCL